jgi:hypothetical protein
MELGSMIIKRM